MSSKKIIKFKNGFTLLEILLVVGIISVLAGIVIVALNPGKMLANTRNTERKSDLKQINNALQQYYIDHQEYPPTLLGSLTGICNTGEVASSSVASVYGANYCSGLVDLSVLVPVYLTAIPADPQFSATSSAGYTVIKYSSSGKIGLEAELAELGVTISVGNVSEVATWACGSSFTDSRDSKVYTTVLIGTQCWMQQNLNIGTKVTGTTTQTNNSIIEKYCYSNDENNCSTYGGLYQWDEMMGYSTTPGIQGICPTGWHIPTHDEFTLLERTTCTSGSCVTDFPYDSVTDGMFGTNEGTTLKNVSGLFRGLLAGNRQSQTNGAFVSIGSWGYFWSSLQGGDSASWCRYLYSGSATVGRGSFFKTYGYSVRCLKD